MKVTFYNPTSALGFDFWVNQLAENFWIQNWERCQLATLRLNAEILLVLQKGFNKRHAFNLLQKKKKKLWPLSLAVFARNYTFKGLWDKNFWQYIRNSDFMLCSLHCRYFFFLFVCFLHPKWCDVNLASGCGINSAKWNLLVQTVSATSIGICIWEGVG